MNKNACGWLIGLVVSFLPAFAVGQHQDIENLRPVIDMHLHAIASDSRLASLWENKVPNPGTGAPLTALTPDDHRRETLEQMEKHGVIMAVTAMDISPDKTFVERWIEAAPNKIIPGVFFLSPNDVSPEWIRSEFEANRLKVIGEIGAPYAGYSAGDAAYEPFFALAEELDIPIAVHAGTPGGGAAYQGEKKYRMELNRPLLLEDMLVRHPKARVYVMHGGWPFIDEAVALLKGHPQVYVDTAIGKGLPREEFYRYLRRMVEAGFGKRIMYGSDQMVWTDAIGHSIRAIEEAEFLSDEQKNDILCGNAARFLRLDPNPCGTSITEDQ